MPKRINIKGFIIHNKRQYNKGLNVYDIFVYSARKYYLIEEGYLSGWITTIDNWYNHSINIDGRIIVYGNHLNISLYNNLELPYKGMSKWLKDFFKYGKNITELSKEEAMFMMTEVLL